MRNMIFTKICEVSELICSTNCNNTYCYIILTIWAEKKKDGNWKNSTRIRVGMLLYNVFCIFVIYGNKRVEIILILILKYFKQISFKKFIWNQLLYPSKVKKGETWSELRGIKPFYTRFSSLSVTNKFLYSMNFKFSWGSSLSVFVHLNLNFRNKYDLFRLSRYSNRIGRR